MVYRSIILCAVFTFLKLLSFSPCSPVFAETRTIFTEAEYIMGDGQTPTFAESMVLQKAKILAVEQAGTYVETYTRIHNLDLAREEINTVAGGVISVEVLERSRTLATEGLRFSIKIKAAVDTQNVDALIGRVRGKPAGQEYAKLLAEYGALAKEVEQLKAQAAATSPGLGLQTVLDRIRIAEKSFAAVQAKEAGLFKRLIAGADLLARAQEQIASNQARKDRRRTALTELFAEIEERGHSIHLSEPGIEVTPDNSSLADVIFMVTVYQTGHVRELIAEVREAYDGEPSYYATKEAEKFLGSLYLQLTAVNQEGQALGCYYFQYSAYGVEDGPDIIAPLRSSPHVFETRFTMPVLWLKKMAAVQATIKRLPEAARTPCRVA